MRGYSNKHSIDTVRWHEIRLDEMDSSKNKQGKCKKNKCLGKTTLFEVVLNITIEIPIEMVFRCCFRLVLYTCSFYCICFSSHSTLYAREYLNTERKIMQYEKSHGNCSRSRECTIVAMKTIHLHLLFSHRFSWLFPWCFLFFLFHICCHRFLS